MGERVTSEAPMSMEQEPYLGEWFYEMLPERDPIIRHLGAKALTQALNGAVPTASRLTADELPSFEAYLTVKYPYLPPAAAADLVQHFHELTELHAVVPEAAPTGDRGAQP